MLTSNLMYDSNRATSAKNDADDEQTYMLFIDKQTAKTSKLKSTLSSFKGSLIGQTRRSRACRVSSITLCIRDTAFTRINTKIVKVI